MISEAAMVLLKSSPDNEWEVVNSLSYARSYGLL